MEREAVLKRIMRYCAETEHCIHDVRQKLRDWEVPEDEIPGILELLRNEKFVDESRYANAYVNEKWKLNGWGKVKMRHQLESKEIAEALIETALANISKADYEEGVEEILNAKWKELKGKRDAGTMQKVAVFGAGRGIEEELILEWVANKGE